MMRKHATRLIALLIARLYTRYSQFQSVDAAPAKFKNCTELNNSYPGGVAT